MKQTFKTGILGVLFLAGMQAAQAQPTTAAPTPTQDAADVVSLFSDHYETTGKGVEPVGWGGDYSVTIETIAGTDDEILKSQKSSNGANTTGWTAQKKGYVHMDVWSDTGGSFRALLGDSFSGNFKEAGDYEWGELKAGAWTSFDVPVVKYVEAGLNDGTNVQMIRFMGDGTYYVDNIYAYGEKEAFVQKIDIPVAPTPTHLAENVRSAFSDSYELATKADPQWVNYAGKTSVQIVEYADGDGQKVLEMKDLSTGGINISNWNISMCDSIHIDVYRYGEDGDGSFQFGLNSDDWSGKKFHFLENFEWPATKTGEWVSFNVPLDEFDSLVKLTGIIMMQFKGSGTFYVDNIYAWYDAPVNGLPSVQVQQSLWNSQLGLQAAEDIETVDIYNMAGQQIMTCVTQGRAVQIDLSTLPSGSYVAVATLANGQKANVQVVK